MESLLARYIRVMFISAPLLIGVTSMTFFVKVDALPKLAAGIMVLKLIYPTAMEIVETEKNPKKPSILWRWYMMMGV